MKIIKTVLSVNKIILLAAGVMAGIMITTSSAEAEAAESIISTIPYLNYNPIEFDKKGEFEISWGSIESYYQGDSTVSYECELAADKGFKKVVKTFEVTEAKVLLDKMMLGKNGGTFYFHVRTKFVNKDVGTWHSNWSQPKTFSCFTINKANFPGIFKLLKKGGRNYGFDGIKEVIYDKNEDGWLDECEISTILQLSTANINYVKKGIHYSKPYIKISSLKGIEKLPNLSSISLSHFSGKKIDLKNNKIGYLSLTGVKSKKLTIIAPDAETVNIQPDYRTKLSKLDVRKCDKVRVLTAYGANKSKVLKLPRVKKHLKVLSISDFSLKKLNLNAYKNLQQLYIYDSVLPNLKLNKCRNLRYMYFYFVKNLSKVDARQCRKLRGVDVYSSPSLPLSRVKVPAKTKITQNKGKWWYGTNAYKNDMKKIN